MIKTSLLSLAAALGIGAFFIPDGAVTTAKIAANAVTSAKLASGAASSNLGAAGGDLSGTFPSPIIAALAVTNSKIANATIDLTTKVTGVLPAANGGATGTNTGDVTLATVGSSPANAGASIAGQVLTLQPADSSHGGVIAASGAQTLAPTFTFSNAPVMSGASISSATIPNASLVNGAVANLSGTNSGDVTLGTFGTSPNAKGATISSQVVTMQPFDATHPGEVPSGGSSSTFLRGDATWVTPTDTGMTALTGDVTASGSGSVATTIAANAVTSSKLASGLTLAGTTTLQPAYGGSSGLTCHAGGGQGSATLLSVGWNNISTCASSGDSLILPVAAFGKIVDIHNAGASTAALFPDSGSAIGNAGANTSVNIFGGATGETFHCIASTSSRWECSKPCVIDNASSICAIRGAVTMSSTLGVSGDATFSNSGATAFTVSTGKSTFSGQSGGVAVVVTGGALAFTTSSYITFASNPNNSSIIAYPDNQATALKIENNSTGLDAIKVVSTTNASKVVIGATLQLPTSDSIAAAGTTQGTATALSATTDVYRVTTGTIVTAIGVSLPTPAFGLHKQVINRSGITISIYPPSGTQIDALTNNTAITLVNGSSLNFDGESATQWNSCCLAAH